MIVTRRARGIVLGPVIPLILALSACAPADPHRKVLEERARWAVNLEGWATREDGTITAEFLVKGPVRSDLRQLTVRVEFYGPQGELLEQRWKTLDLSRVSMGTPTRMTLSFAPPEGQVEGLAVVHVTNPSSEEERHIPELATAAKKS